MSRTLLAFFLCGLYTVTCVKNVTIAKCCKMDEYLSNENKCLRSADLEWSFNVFSPVKKTFVYKNQVPPNWHLKMAVKPACARPALLTYQVGSYVPFHNGSLWVPVYDTMYHPDEFCIDYKSVLFCLKEPQSMADVKVKKCCGPNGIFSSTKNSCIHVKDESYRIQLGPDKRLVQGLPHCKEHEYVFLGKLDNDSILNNGSLWIPHTKMLLPMENYCLEHVLENSTRSPSIMVCQEHLSSVTVATAKAHSDLRFIIYPIALALGAVFLVATLAAGAILPASHHVLHWRCQTNHVACLLVGDVLLCIIQLSGHIEYPWCMCIVVSMYFFFLAAFFWLNTMCFNIWWTFRDLRPQSVEKSQERCRLHLYQVYAWGVPLIMAATAAMLDTVSDNNSDFLKPKFCLNSTWFDGDMEKLTFFYGPIGVLLLVNLALFTLTAKELTCGLWKRELVKSTSERAALGRVCLKLVVVMGVSWILDVGSWLVGGPNELWYLTDIINCLQGVFIFIVVGCQPQVLSAVKRLWCSKMHRENGTAGTTNHHSSSSQGPPSMGDTVTNHSVTNTTKSIPLETSC